MATQSAAADIKQLIEKANYEAVARINAGDPILVDILPAGEVIPGLKDRLVLHSGPPIDWPRMSGAQRGSMAAILMYEKWAGSPAEAFQMLEGGEIEFAPAHHFHAVGPMAGTISRSMPVWVVENRAFGNHACARLVDGRQQFGDFSEAAVSDLRLWTDVWAPTIREGLRQMGGLELKPLMAKALQMGDELHNRPVAASSLFANILVAPLIEAVADKDNLLSTVRYVVGNELLFLGIAMASAKCIADAAVSIEYSTVVVAMARNGTEFGIRVSGLGDEWFTAPAPRVNGLYLPGFSENDAGADMGDSAITETVGWGGFVLGGSPGHLARVGGTPEEALAYNREMRQITLSTHPVYRLPALGFEGAPVGIDIRRVVQTGIAPIIDTAIAHKDPGHAIIGAGTVRAPLECFQKALRAFGNKYLK